MTKDETLATLEELTDSLFRLAGKSILIAAVKIQPKEKRKPLDFTRDDIVIDIKTGCRKWFDVVKPALVELGLDHKDIDSYDAQFKKLINNVHLIDFGNSAGDTILLKTAIILKLQVIPSVYPLQEQTLELKFLEELLYQISSTERSYLLEALGCVKYGFYRAAIVLGWNSAIHRIHSILVRNGLEHFNKASHEMKQSSSRRFRRFNKVFDVKTQSDLSSSVFDSDLLWVVEFMRLISKNQHDRLKSCYNLRCDAAHPSDVPVSHENLVSFFSDLKRVVFENDVLTI